MAVQANIVSIDVSIPRKVHARLLGGGFRLIQDIQDNCGGVHIKFPPEKSVSDKVCDNSLCSVGLLWLLKFFEIFSFETLILLAH